MPVQEGKSQPEPAPGRVPAGDFESVTELPQPPPPPPLHFQPENVIEDERHYKPNEQVAQEVLAGHWGRGQRRIQRLKEAGYDSVMVQVEIDKIINRV